MLLGDAAKQFEHWILERHPDIETVVTVPRDLPAMDCSDVDFVVGWKFPVGIFGRMPNLTWIQSISVGVDGWIHDSTIPPSTVITNTKGLYSAEVAEYIIWALITLSRRFDVAVRNQQRRRWRPVHGASLAGKTVGVAGMGSVGQATATIARAMGMKVVGICRSGEEESLQAMADEIVESSRMDAVLGQLDALVACLPLTDETRGLFDGRRIAMLKAGAVVVNAAREDVFDYASLRRAVREGRLAGAALDVFEKEPLPRRSALWKTEHVLLTPHVSGLTPDYKARVADLICTNLDHLRLGEPLDCQVNRTRGY